MLFGAAGNYAHAQGQGTKLTFGKNRVQYKDFDWFYFRTFNFDTYYYRGGKELAQNVSKLAEANLAELEEFLDYKMESRLQIMVYNKQSDFFQTNLGLEDDLNANPGGITEIIGTRIFVYFSGDHYDLQRQIRNGLAQVMVAEMMYGGSIQEMFQNSTLLTLPPWYLDGLLSYLSLEWSMELETEVKLALDQGKYEKFNRLFGDDAINAGHSIWKYIVDSYGVAALSNILYMTRINRNAESGFLYIIGMNYDDIVNEWRQYLKDEYLFTDKRKESPPESTSYKIRKKRKVEYSQFKLSNDGRQVAYVSNDDGRVKIWVHDMLDKKSYVVYRYGYRTFRNVDYSMPKLAWHPSGLILAVNYERKSYPIITTIKLADKEKQKIEMYKFEKINDFSYSPDGRKWVISAMKNGQSDIFVFDIPSRRESRITNDYYDDKHPTFVNYGTEIVFSSNRPDGSLEPTALRKLAPFKNFDLFKYKYDIRDTELIQLTNTPLANETAPVEFDSTFLSFLSDASGINNRFVGYTDSVYSRSMDTVIYEVDTTIQIFKDTFYSVPISNYGSSVIEHDISVKGKKLVQVFKEKDAYQFFMGPLGKFTDNQVSSIELTGFKKVQKRNYSKYLKEQEERALAAADTLPIITDPRIEIEEGDEDLDTSAVDIDNYYFQTDLPSDSRTKKARDLVSEENSKPEVSNIDDLEELLKGSRAKPYDGLFSSKYIVSQVNNTPLLATYERFTGTGPIYNNVGIGGMIQVGSADLLQDYKITGGFRIAGNFTIPEYFISYENLKKRLDKQVVFYKKGETRIGDIFGVKSNTYETRGTLSYPFTEIQRVSLSGFHRMEEGILLATDLFALSVPNQLENWVGYRVEYVFDNTLNFAENLYYGTRAKIYAEQFKLLSDQDVLISNIGVDIRHYEKIHKQLILATRLAGATSVSKQKTMYYMGGLDNRLIPKFNQKTQIDQTNDYYFQALATNMRGFTQNIRNGHSYAVLNVELRVPIFSYLITKPIKNEFVKNLQLVGFTDLGSAWVGANPFGEINLSNKRTISSGPLDVTIIEPKYPIVGGMGGGLRTKVFGYFVRGDVAYGIENGFILAPMYYLSLSLDF